MPHFITTSGLPIALVMVVVLMVFLGLDVEPVVVGIGV